MKMKSMQVESLILKNSESDVDIEKCLVVSKYREHITTTKTGTMTICNEEEESDIRTEFQICSHNTTTQLYEDIQTINSDRSVMDIVCQALKDLSDECIGYLLDCFLEDDLLDMKRLHLEEVTGFLLKFENVKITKNTISECEAVQEIFNNIDLKEEITEENERFQTFTKISEREASLSKARSNFIVFHFSPLMILLIAMSLKI